MRKLKHRRWLLLILTVSLAVVGFGVFAYCRAKQTHGRRTILSFATARPVLEALRSEVPPQLKEPNEGRWNAWAQQEDNAVRARSSKARSIP